MEEKKKLGESLDDFDDFNPIDSGIEILRKLEDKAGQYKCFDRHAFRAFTSYVQTAGVSKETKVIVWIMSPFILFTALFLFIIMFPIRLYSDIRYVFYDILSKLEDK